MSTTNIHANLANIDVDFVKKLLQEQFPQWSELSLSLLESAGAGNAIFRLGKDMCVRLPRMLNAEGDSDPSQLRPRSLNAATDVG